jgi:hypothetical protein
MPNDPAEYLDLLLHLPPTSLPSLSGGGGLYSLTDENGIVRYIGETGNSFFDRIHNRHCAGDDNSHKYSTVFNAGRLWQPASCDKNAIKHATNDQTDGKHAKALRTRFARTRCFARTIHLPDLAAADRKEIEAAILRLAPAENKVWNDSRNLTSYEPEGIEAFMREIGWPVHRIEAAERQKARWDSLPKEERAVVRATRKRQA